MKSSTLIDILNNIAVEATDAGVIHLNATSIDSNTFISKGKSYINFGSCSYLGLEQNPRLQASAKAAIDDFGTQFSSSRAYVSCGLYEELESNLSEIFEAHAIVMPTTTLGHIATLPVIVGDNDAIIVDHQVHSSVQTAVQLLRARRVKVDMIRHSRMDQLEQRLEHYGDTYERVWYMADGVYSMYGDKAPLEELYTLMDKYPQLYIYIDDAHAMCCYGDRGQGYVLQHRALHEKMVLATSLNKAFASGGGVVVTRSAEMARDIRNCGGPLITSGPLQPGSLGAGIEVSRMLLAGDTQPMQCALHDRIQYANLLIEKAGLPIIAANDTPVFFIGVGLPRVGYNMVKRLMSDGYFTNLGIFPAVPVKNTGIRFTITSLSTLEHIRGLISAIAKHLPLALDEENYSIEEVRKAFGMKSDEEKVYERIQSLLKSAGLKMERYQSITELDQEEWAFLFAGRGIYDPSALALMEQAYSQDDERIEHHWDFDYLIIRDDRGQVVLATLFTTALSKDDMLSVAEVSAHIEETRKTEPYYLTSRVLTMGTMLSLGEALFIDKSHAAWSEAVERCLEFALTLQEERKTDAIMLRDFRSPDNKLVNLIKDYGFMHMSLPDDHEIDISSFNSSDDYVASLTYKGRRHVRATVLKEDNYRARLVTHVDEKDVDNWVRLMKNVKARNFAVNTFDIKAEFFHLLALNPSFEAIELIDEHAHVAAVIINYKNGDSYDLMYIGIDYNHIDGGVYRKCLFYAIDRAIKCGYDKVGMGVTASFEKTRLGAVTRSLSGYGMVKEHFNMEVISSLEQYVRG